MSFLADFVLENLAAAGQPTPAIYSQILRHCYAEPPPFARRSFGQRYRELAGNAEWFANSLVANAALEGYGATQIWKFANQLEDPRHAEAVRQHSLDESRHSTMFVRMLDLTFPDIGIDAATRNQIEGLQPHYTTKHHPPISPPEGRASLPDHAAMRELIGVHITEIRALVLQHLLRPVLLAYAPSASHRVLTNASDALIRDEARHIGYSSVFFEEFADAGEREFLFETFANEVHTFNDLTLEELERDKVEV